MTVHVELLTRSGCHLCDEAQEVVERVVRTAASDGLAVSFHATDIDERTELVSLYSDEVPVVFINGRQHTYWKVDEQRFDQVLRAAGTKDKVEF